MEFQRQEQSHEASQKRSQTNLNNNDLIIGNNNTKTYNLTNNNTNNINMNRIAERDEVKQVNNEYSDLQKKGNINNQNQQQQQQNQATDEKNLIQDLLYLRNLIPDSLNNEQNQFDIDNEINSEMVDKLFNSYSAYDAFPPSD